MQYTLLTDSFGGLNSYMSDDKVGPNAAVVSQGVDISDGSLRNRLDDEKPTLNVDGVWYVDAANTYIPATAQTIAQWKSGALGMTQRYAVAEFGGRLYRSHKGFGPFPVDTTGIQYTSNSVTIPTWDYFGLMAPDSDFNVTDSGAGGSVPAGTYSYYATFVNDLGQESPPREDTLTFTGSKQPTVTVPDRYTTATFASSGLTTITVGDSSRLRVGMRIKCSSIPSDAYITEIVSSTSIKISKATTGSASGVDIIDPQVTKVRVYRSGNGITTPKLVDEVSISTGSFSDNKTNDQLGYEITTIGTSEVPPYLRDVCISPSGVLMCVGPNDTMYYFSLTSNKIYDPSKTIKVASAPMAAIWALDRFIFPTQRGAFCITIDDAILGIPIVQIIDDNEPCQGSYYVYPVDVGGAVWWNTSKGIVATDGNTIETVTKYVIDRDIAVKFIDAYGAGYYNGEYFIYARTGNSANSASIFSYTRKDGWTELVTTMKNTSPGTIGFNNSYNCVVYTGNSSDVSAAVRTLRTSAARLANGFYRIGSWAGEKNSSLKKFRKISALMYGDIAVQVFIDGSNVYTTQLTSGVMTRVSAWLPPSRKGRSISLGITMQGASSIVEELGVWVGEEREPMP